MWTRFAQQFEVHPTQVMEWRKQLLERAAEAFCPSAPVGVKALHAKIGQLTRENDLSE